MPSSLESWAQIGDGLLRVASDEFLAANSGRDTFGVMLASLDVEHQLAGRHPVNQSLYIWGKTMLPNYILSNLGDRMEMAHSIEGRLPFLDHAQRFLDIGRGKEQHHVRIGLERPLDPLQQGWIVEGRLPRGQQGDG